MAPDAAGLEAHRTALAGHGCRMLGSVVDENDAVHEAMVRAWRSLGRFDRRAPLRSWLLRIATNVCLDLLADRKRCARPAAGVGTRSEREEVATDPSATQPSVATALFPGRVALAAAPLARPVPPGSAGVSGALPERLARRFRPPRAVLTCRAWRPAPRP